MRNGDTGSSSITDRKIWFALVGCGRISANHFNAMRKHAERSELVGGCDLNAEALDMAASETGAKPYANVTELLRDATADVVIDQTLSERHADQAIEIAATGRQFVTEKLARTLAAGMRR